MRSRCFLMLAAAFLPSLVSMSADGANHPIAAVEVSSRVARHDRDLRASLRDKTEKQLLAVDWSSLRQRGPFVLSTTLMQLDTDTSNGSARVACAVSMTLRDQKRGVLRAVVEGRSSSENKPDAVAAAEEEALRVAVRGAVRGLPEAVRRSE